MEVQGGNALVEKLEAGRAMKQVASTFHEWLSDLDVPTEEALQKIGQIVDEWRQNNGSTGN